MGILVTWWEEEREKKERKNSFARPQCRPPLWFQLKKLPEYTIYNFCCWISLSMLQRPNPLYNNFLTTRRNDYSCSCPGLLREEVLKGGLFASGTANAPFASSGLCMSCSCSHPTVMSCIQREKMTTFNANEGKLPSNESRISALKTKLPKFDSKVCT